jgi:metal-dependent amidase/aminoacylase/carboxypeptidase family protein
MKKTQIAQLAENLRNELSATRRDFNFALYQQQITGVMYWLGATNLQKDIISVPHMPGFDIDEECLVIGTKVMANVLLAYLDHHQ